MLDVSHQGLYLIILHLIVRETINIVISALLVYAVVNYYVDSSYGIFEGLQCIKNPFMGQPITSNRVGRANTHVKFWRKLLHQIPRNSNFECGTSKSTNSHITDRVKGQ